MRFDTIELTCNHCFGHLDFEIRQCSFNSTTKLVVEDCSWCAKQLKTNGKKANNQFNIGDIVRVKRSYFHNLDYEYYGDGTQSKFEVAVFLFDDTERCYTYILKNLRDCYQMQYVEEKYLKLVKRKEIEKKEIILKRQFTFGD